MLNDYGPLMTVRDACDVLMVGKNTIYSLINEHQLDAFQIDRTWKVKRDSLALYIRRQAGLVPS